MASFLLIPGDREAYLKFISLLAVQIYRTVTSRDPEMSTLWTR